MSFVILILTVIGGKMTLQCWRKIFVSLFMHEKICSDSERTRNKQKGAINVEKLIPLGWYKAWNPKFFQIFFPFLEPRWSHLAYIILINTRKWKVLWTWIEKKSNKEKLCNTGLLALVLPSTIGKQQIYHFEQIIWDSEGKKIKFMLFPNLARRLRTKVTRQWPQIAFRLIRYSVIERCGKMYVFGQF